MKIFESTTVHYTTKNGKTTGTKEHVVVKDGKGTKTVEEIEDHNNSVESERLTQKEIKHIMNRRFVPKLFSNLHLLNQSNLVRMNTNNNNGKNNKNRTRRRSASKIDHGNASKKKTQKRRRQ
jgi:hypothetical protein